ncbi:sigma-54 interaction domain-containing protein [Paenibacillus sp. SGZ-1009]|uniref:sigma-54 interaction domain-containing protein n=1 Tax=Paenibacillus campi TaxID=3106031 RepID=UPI002B0007A4|nr:sigma 54-interacting transcriptional regulator [Paenibacillus sp. SGZ-1009]
MFNNEQIHIQKRWTSLQTEHDRDDLIRLLESDTAVWLHIETERYVFTTADLRFWRQWQGELAAGIRCFEPSAVLKLPLGNDSERGQIVLEHLFLPAQLDRPVIVVTADGTPQGWLSAAGLAAQLLRQKQRAELYLQALLDTVTDAVTAVDQDGTVICWNDTAAQMYDIPHERIIGHTIDELFDPESLMLLHVLDKGRKIRNMYHQSSEGTHVLINASPIMDASGTIVGGLASEQDITHLVKLNQELSTAQASIHETLPRSSDPFTLLDGQSHSISKVVRIGKKVAELNTPVLLYGETGSGKEQLARAIHLASAHADAPFLSVNCGAIPPGLLDSELFGFIGGTYSGQDIQEAGKLEQAGTGTLFLNEIDRLTPDMQNKLYRALKTRVFRRYGGQDELPLHARIIAASRHNLEKLVTSGQFSSELYYALGVVTIAVPPLRERREDIAILVHMYLREFAMQYHKPLPKPTPDVLMALARYDWPGNVAELRAVIERCIILSDGDELHPELLPDSFQKLLHFPASAPVQLPIQRRHTDEPIATMQPTIQHQGLKARISDEEEKQRIEEAIHKASGNKSIAARLLGISRGTLYNKMSKHGMD